MASSSSSLDDESGCCLRHLCCPFLFFAFFAFSAFRASVAFFFSCFFRSAAAFRSAFLFSISSHLTFFASLILFTLSQNACDETHLGNPDIQHPVMLVKGFGFGVVKIASIFSSSVFTSFFSSGTSTNLKRFFPMFITIVF